VCLKQMSGSRRWRLFYVFGQSNAPHQTAFRFVDTLASELSRCRSFICVMRSNPSPRSSPDGAEIEVMKET
jgi:hypothetical protein